MSNEEQLNQGRELSAAQRARLERQRARARELRQARLGAANRPTVIDSGGGFLIEEERAASPPLAAAPSAPPADRALWPACLECGAPFATSYLLETFEYAACDSCRDDDGRHSLLTRTDAKAEFLLQDCDLDSRPPPLRCLRRRNPHGRADMRLYLRAALEARALLVWGSQEALEEARLERESRREKLRSKRYARELRALRCDVRSGLFARVAPRHEHDWGPEHYDEASDQYTRECACGANQTYEKM